MLFFKKINLKTKKLVNNIILIMKINLYVDTRKLKKKVRIDNIIDFISHIIVTSQMLDHVFQ